MLLQDGYTYKLKDPPPVLCSTPRPGCCSLSTVTVALESMYLPTTLRQYGVSGSRDVRRMDGGMAVDRVSLVW